MERVADYAKSLKQSVVFTSLDDMISIVTCVSSVVGCPGNCHKKEVMNIGIRSGLSGPPLPNLMYLEGGCLGVRSTFLPFHYIRCLWDIPAEIMYFGVFAHGIPEQRTATNNALKGLVGISPSTLVNLG